MIFPQLQENLIEKDFTSYFGGYNHNIYIKKNEFYDMENMTSDYYPVLSPRVKRGFIKQYDKFQGILAKEKMCIVDNDNLYYDNVLIGKLNDKYSGKNRELVSMGAYLVIFPDKMIFNTASEEKKLEPLEASFEADSGVAITLCDLNATDYSYGTPSAKAPTSPTTGQYWLDTSGTSPVLKQYSTDMWVSIATVYLKISKAGIGKDFSKYDGVTISNISDTKLNSDYVLYDCSDDYLVVVGLIDKNITDTPIKVERKVPDMDFVCESENRLWGCSSAKNEIYSCKLGDAKNWNCYMGVSTDSYTVTIGSDGDFTGAITHLGYVLFFKEDILHKVYGSMPKDYRVTNVKLNGVQKGSHKSLCILNSVLYYKSKDNICRFEGSLPSTISEPLGMESYDNAVACTLKDKYYICMTNKSTGRRNIFVFDSVKGLWHKEDEVNVLDFGTYDGELYFIDDKGIRQDMYCIKGSQGELQPFKWYAETGIIHSETLDKKYISKIQFRVSVEKGAKFEIYIDYDEENNWEKKFTIYATKNKVFTVPIIPRRCDYIRLRLTGEGDCKVFTIVKCIEEGSEI